MKYIPKPDLEEINASQKHNYFRDAIILITGFLVIFITIYFLLITVSDWALSKISLEQEVRWFGNIWLEESSKEEMPKDINRLVSHINSQVPFPITVKIMCSKESNAFALPGGLLFLTSGLLETLKTENGLTFVMGHEAGHIVHRDSIRGMGRAIIFTLSAIIFNFGGASDLTVFNQFIERAYSVDQEIEADRYGLMLTKKIYGHTWGAEELFQLLSSKETLLEKSLAHLAGTHPSFKTRMSKIRHSQLGHSQKPRKLSPSIKDWLTKSECSKQ